jgi:hypothetical protein
MEEGQLKRRRFKTLAAALDTLSARHLGEVDLEKRGPMCGNKDNQREGPRTC